MGRLNFHMTPIRVRGKKLKSSGISQEGKQISKLKEQPKPIMSRPARELSQLERLPNELLQEIFLQSLNLNLPGASLTLGLNLASPHIKMLLVLKAFSSNSGKCLEHSAGLLGILHTKQEIARLQTAILRLRWMTLDFLRQHIRIFLVKTILRRFLELNLDWIDGSKPTETTVAELLENAYKDDSLGISGGLLGNHSFTWNVGCNTLVFLQVGLRVGDILLRVTTNEHDHNSKETLQYRWRLLLCLDQCRIPDKLLHGPWTDAKCDFLEVITRSGASIDWVNSTSGEVADLGLKEALLERNQRAVEVLVNRPLLRLSRSSHFIHVGRFNVLSRRERTPDTKSRNFHKQVRRKKSLKLCVGVPLRTEHLRIAVLQEGFPKGIVECLLRGTNSKIDLEDDVVNKWALQKKISGNKHGKWLYERLAGLRETAQLGYRYFTSDSETSSSASSDDERDSIEIEYSEKHFEHLSSSNEDEDEDSGTN